MLKKILSALITLILGGIIYYVALPAINLHSIGFYTYVLFLLLVFYVSDLILNVKTSIRVITKFNVSAIKNFWIFIVALVVGAGILIVNFILSPLFNADAYSERISINEEHDFSTDVELVDFNKIPLLDKDSSQKLGDRKMGEMSEWVSQFTVSDLYTQINFNDSIIRVTPIEYASFIKWITNRKDGIKGYITVNSVNGNANLVSLDNGIKYTESAYFNDNIYRQLRFKYPTKIFGDLTFEIDNEGNPYWIAPTIKYVGVGLRPDVNGAVVFNAVTGESKFYKVDEIPTWIDHVYSASLIVDQVDDWGEYRNGFFNSIFGQKNVVNTTEGYNYLAMEDDIYLYTGITSVSNDESNLGFILTNMRTKETNFYGVAGAEEFSAMSSAEGLVQEKGYRASFPLLINLNGNATYLMSLKDSAGLVKMYSLVDVQDYQKVITSDVNLGIEEAGKKFLNEFVKEDISSHLIDTTLIVKSVKDVVIDGNTYYYITDNDDNNYSVSIKVDRNKLPFIKSGDTLEVSYIENDLRIIQKIK